VSENATDYSLNNTVRNMLFLPLSSEEKYSAKQATDTFSRGAGHWLDVDRLADWASVQRADEPWGIAQGRLAVRPCHFMKIRR
jgi:hypothetical protein